MAEKNRTTLKGYFETGDTPTESQFADLIDSAFNKTDDAAVGALAAVMGGASENVQAIAWDNTMHLNTFTDAGVYRITGIRTGYGSSSAFDGFPIENAGATSQIDALLYVLDSSLSTADDGGLACVSQILVLSNRVGRDGHTYTRTARAASKAEIASVLTKGAGHWSDWGKLQTNVEVGVVTNGYRLDNSGNVISTAGLDTLTDNGIYSGVYLPNSAFDTATETFVMVVINNYAVAGDSKTITQVKFATVANGSFTFQKRQRTLGSTTWGAWTTLNNKLSKAGISRTDTTNTLTLTNADSSAVAATLPAATTDYAGLMTASDKSSLSTIKNELDVAIKWEESIVTQTDAYRRALISGLKEIGYNDQEVMDCLSDVPNLTLEDIEYAKEIMNNWDPSTTDMTEKFRLDSNLVIMPKIDTSNVIKVYRTWSACVNLAFMPQMDFSKVTYFSQVFWDMSSDTLTIKNQKIKRLYDFDLSSVQTFYACFSRMEGLTRIGTITIGPACTTYYFPFQGTYNLPTEMLYKNLIFKDMSAIQNMNGGFSSCNLSWIEYSHFYNATTLNHMFSSNQNSEKFTYDLSGITFSSDCTTPVSMDSFFAWDELTGAPKLDFPGGISKMSNFFNNMTISFKTVPDYSQYTPTTFQYFIATQYSSVLERIEGLNFANCSNTVGMFIYYTSMPGNGGLNPSCKYIRIINLGQCEEGTIYWLNGVKNWGAYSDENRQSLIDSLITNSFDRASAGYATATLHLDKDVVARLTDEEKAAITAKGYTITIYS